MDTSGKLFHKFFKPVLPAAGTFVSGRMSKEPLGTTVLKTASTAAMWFFAPEIINFIEGGRTIANVASAATTYYDHSTAKLKTSYRRNFGGNYMDTQQAYTMRQAAFQAMNQTGLHARQVLGNEASLLHR